MLEFENVIKVDSTEKTAVYVFVDKDKGHTVYLSHSGSLTVVEEGISKKNNIRAAGFLNNNDNCSDCSGC